MTRRKLLKSIAAALATISGGHQLLALAQAAPTPIQDEARAKRYLDALLEPWAKQRRVTIRRTGTRCFSLPWR